jgi:hypothetical protein
VFRQTCARLAIIVAAWLIGSRQSRAQEAQATQTAIAPAQVPLVWKRWPLFDPFVDPHESGLSFEWTEWREHESRIRSAGATIAIASQVSTLRRHLASTIRTQTIALSMLEGPTFALGLMQYDLLGSLDFGFIRFGAGAGLLPISFDYGRGDFSVALGSPRAIASLSFKVGVLRIAVSGVTSYLPRVSGRGDVVTRSVALEFLLEKPRPLKRVSHPLLIR